MRTPSSMMTRPSCGMRSRPAGPATNPNPGPPMVQQLPISTLAPITAWLITVFAPTRQSAPSTTPLSMTAFAAMWQRSFGFLAILEH